MQMPSTGIGESTPCAATGLTVHIFVSSIEPFVKEGIRETTVYDRLRQRKKWPVHRIPSYRVAAG